MLEVGAWGLQAMPRLPPLDKLQVDSRWLQWTGRLQAPVPGGRCRCGFNGNCRCRRRCMHRCRFPFVLR